MAQNRNLYAEFVESMTKSHHSALMEFYNKMFDKDNFCYVIENNKIGIDYEDSLVSYEISTCEGTIFHIKIFEGDKLIDESFWHKTETGDYEEIVV
jgi:hypothetical protein